MSTLRPNGEGVSRVRENLGLAGSTNNPAQSSDAFEVYLGPEYKRSDFQPKPTIATSDSGDSGDWVDLSTPQSPRVDFHHGSDCPCRFCIRQSVRKDIDRQRILVKHSILVLILEEEQERARREQERQEQEQEQERLKQERLEQESRDSIKIVPSSSTRPVWSTILETPSFMAQEEETSVEATSVAATSSKRPIRAPVATFFAKDSVDRDLEKQEKIRFYIERAEKARAAQTLAKKPERTWYGRINQLFEGSSTREKTSFKNEVQFMATRISRTFNGLRHQCNKILNESHPRGSISLLTYLHIICSPISKLSSRKLVDEKFIEKQMNDLASTFLEIVTLVETIQRPYTSCLATLHARCVENPEQFLLDLLRDELEFVNSNLKYQKKERAAQKTLGMTVSDLVNHKVDVDRIMNSPLFDWKQLFGRNWERAFAEFLKKKVLSKEQVEIIVQITTNTLFPKATCEESSQAASSTPVENWEDIMVESSSTSTTSTTSSSTTTISAEKKTTRKAKSTTTRSGGLSKSGDALMQKAEPHLRLMRDGGYKDRKDRW